jgi:hypothetical protein
MHCNNDTKNCVNERNFPWSQRDSDGNFIRFYLTQRSFRQVAKQFEEKQRERQEGVRIIALTYQKKGTMENSLNETNCCLHRIASKTNESLRSISFDRKYLFRREAEFIFSRLISSHLNTVTFNILHTLYHPGFFRNTHVFGGSRDSRMRRHGRRHTTSHRLGRRSGSGDRPPEQWHQGFGSSGRHFIGCCCKNKITTTNAINNDAEQSCSG